MNVQKGTGERSVLALAIVAILAILLATQGSARAGQADRANPFATAGDEAAATQVSRATDGGPMSWGGDFSGGGTSGVYYAFAGLNDAAVFDSFNGRSVVDMPHQFAQWSREKGSYLPVQRIFAGPSLIDASRAAGNWMPGKLELPGIESRAFASFPFNQFRFIDDRWLGSELQAVTVAGAPFEPDGLIRQYGDFIPEPASLILMACGGMLLLWRGTSRQKPSKQQA